MWDTFFCHGKQIYSTHWMPHYLRIPLFPPLWKKCQERETKLESACHHDSIPSHWPSDTPHSCETIRRFQKWQPPGFQTRTGFVQSSAIVETVNFVNLIRHIDLCKLQKASKLARCSPHHTHRLKKYLKTTQLWRWFSCYNCQKRGRCGSFQSVSDSNSTLSQSTIS